MTTPNERPVEPAKPHYLRIWANAHANHSALGDVSRVRATLYKPAYASASNRLATIDSDSDADTRGRVAHDIAMKVVEDLMATHNGVRLVSQIESEADQEAVSAVDAARKDYAVQMQEYQAALEAWQKEQDGEAAAG